MALSAEREACRRTIGIVAGEASGDLLGSQLIGALRELMPQVHFSGIGGPRMEAAGMEVLFPLEKLAVRGYIEVLKHFSRSSASAASCAGALSPIRRTCSSASMRPISTLISS